MSVFIIEPKTIENICRTLESGDYFTNGSKNMLYSYLEYGYFFPDENGNDTNRIRSLLKKLYEINIISWNERYNENEPLETNIIDFNKGKPTNIYQLLKSLECLRYQIEGEILEQDSRVQDLDRLIEQITSKIINNLPEYENAKWN